MEKHTEILVEPASADQAPEHVIEMKHIKKSFGPLHVLKDINLQLKRGENLVVMGKSGTGKSVLIKCIIKLLEADDGELFVLGKNMNELKEADLNELRKKVGFLFQGAALYDSMTVRENLEFPFRRHFNTDIKKEIDRRVKEVLENVGLLDAIDKMPSELSGGMKKRIGLARTLMLQPEVILYDEPTTGLDPVTSKEISMLILELQKKYKTTSIIITHDIECAKITANRVVMLDEGKFVAEGTFKQLHQSKQKLVASFFK